MATGAAILPRTIIIRHWCTVKKKPPGPFGFSGGFFYIFSALLVYHQAGGLSRNSAAGEVCQVVSLAVHLSTDHKGEAATQTGPRPKRASAHPRPAASRGRAHDKAPEERPQPAGAAQGAREGGGRGRHHNGGQRRAARRARRPSAKREADNRRKARSDEGRGAPQTQPDQRGRGGQPNRGARATGTRSGAAKAQARHQNGPKAAHRRGTAACSCPFAAAIQREGRYRLPFLILRSRQLFLSRI